MYGNLFFQGGANFLGYLSCLRTMADGWAVSGGQPPSGQEWKGLNTAQVMFGSPRFTYHYNEDISAIWGDVTKPRCPTAQHCHVQVTVPNHIRNRGPGQ